MSDVEVISYVESLGMTVEKILGKDQKPYFVIRNYNITSGSLAGKVCDVAIQQTGCIPYVPPSAIHVKPILIPMGQRNTLASGVGPEWQYWSRVFAGRAQTPKSFYAHIATIFNEV